MPLLSSSRADPALGPLQPVRVRQMRGELSQLDTGLSLDQVQDLLGMRLGSEGASIVSLRPWRDVAFPLPLRNPLIARPGCPPPPPSPQTVPPTARKRVV